jgi:hypothetical protein
MIIASDPTESNVRGWLDSEFGAPVWRIVQLWRTIGLTWLAEIATSLRRLISAAMMTKLRRNAPSEWLTVTTLSFGSTPAGLQNSQGPRE